MKNPTFNKVQTKPKLDLPKMSGSDQCFKVKTHLDALKAQNLNDSDKIRVHKKQ